MPRSANVCPRGTRKSVTAASEQDGRDLRFADDEDEDSDNEMAINHAW